MAKSKKNPYSDIIFVNNDKKVLDKDDEMGDNSDMGEIVREFTPEVKAYVPYFNPELKIFEMFTVLIDPVSGETKLERKELKHDSEPRAVMEMQKMYAEDNIKKIKETLKRDTKGNK